MKNISFLLALSFLLSAASVQGQPSFYLSPEFQLVDQFDQVCYKVRTENFTTLFSTSFTLRWTPGVLDNAFINPTSLNPELVGLNLGDFQINNAEGYMTFDWSSVPCNTPDINLSTTLFPDQQALFEICFEAVGIYGKHTEISFSNDPTPIVVHRHNSQCNNIMPPSGFTKDGFLSIGTEPLRVHISSADGFQGETVCLDFDVEDFDNLVSTQYYIFYEPQVLLFESAMASGLPGFNNANLNFSIPGLGVVSWNAVGSPVSVPDGTQVLQVCFKIIGSCGQSSPVYIADNEDNKIEIIDYISTDLDGTNIGLLDIPGEVTVKCFSPNGINLTVEDKNVCPGETFTVDVTTSNFTDIAKLLFSLKWNPSIIQLTNTSGDGISFPPSDNAGPCLNFNTPGVLKTFPSEGRIDVKWEPLFLTSGCTIPNGQRLMRLHFRAVGPSGSMSTISIVDSILVDEFGGQTVNVGINNNNGLVRICELESPTFIAQGSAANPGENICINISTLDFDQITEAFFNISWEPAILSYTGVQAFNLPGLAEFNFIADLALVQGDLGVAWENNGIPVTMPDGSILFQVCFDVIGDPDSCSMVEFTENFVPINIETALSNETNVGLNSQGNSICVLDPFDFFLKADDVYGTPGQQVRVNISAENFIQMRKVQHTLNWSPDVIRYDSIVSTGVLPNFSAIHFNDTPALLTGQLTVNWTTNSLNGVTVPDGVPIYALYFTIVGDPSDCSGVDIDDFIVNLDARSALTGNANLGIEVDNGSVCVNQSFLVAANVQIMPVDCPSFPSGRIDLTIQGGSGIYSYQWAGQGVLTTAEDQNALYPGYYHVTVTDVVNPALQLSLPNLLVELSPLAPIADAGPDTTFTCSGGLATLVLDGSGSTQSGVTYAWSVGPGFPGIIQDGNTLHPTIIGGSSYILTVTRNNPLCVVRDTVKVGPAVFPNPDILPSVVQEISCEHDTITINGGEEQFVFNIEWTTSGGEFVPGTETTMQPRVTEPGWYYLRMIHPFSNCEETDSIYIGENRIYPEAEAGQNQSLGCDDPFVLLDGDGSSTDNVTYEWTFLAGGEICGANDQPTANACAPGTYHLTVTNTLSGCTAIDETVVEGDTLSPVADAGQDWIINCEQSIAVLDGSGSSQGSDYLYSWINETGDTVGFDLEFSTEIGGVYSLEVLNTSNGCKSSSQAIVTVDKTIPNAVATVDHPITCDSTSATLDAAGSSAGPEFIYEWMAPSGNVISTDTLAEVSEPGLYTLVVINTQNECSRTFPIEVIDNSAPVQVEAGDPAILGCGPGVQLNGSFVSLGDDVLMQWSGSGLTCIANSTTTQPTVSCPGMYYFTVQDVATGCIGIDSVMVTPDVTPPMVNAGTDAVFPCSVDVLQLTGTSSLTNITVLWTNQNGLPIENETTLTPSIEAPGTYQMVVTNNANQCTASDFVVISSPVLPTATITGATMTDCSTPTVVLNGSSNTPNVGFLWTALSGNVPQGQETQPQVEVPAGEYVLTVTDQNGCTGITSHIIQPDENFPVANAGDDAEIPCGGGTIQLDASASDPGMNYIWTDASGLIVGSGLTASVTATGTYTLTVTNPANQCQATDLVQVSQATGGDTPAEATFDHDPCEIEAVIMGNLPTGATGIWASPTGATIENPTSATTNVSGLVSGPNVFNWTLSLGSCQNYSTAQVIIQIDQSVPRPFSDLATIELGNAGTVTVNVLENDQFDPATTLFNLLTTDVPGEVTFTPDGTVTFTKSKCYTGTVVLEYELCNTECPDLCNKTTLTIDIQPDEDEGCDEVTNGITPNGDGVNDEFVFDVLINGQEKYPNNEMIIFNRWGDIIYEARPYLNDWSGTNQKGEELPHGTYYYILRLDVANSEIIRGDVTILK